MSKQFYSEQFSLALYSFIVKRFYAKQSSLALVCSLVLFDR